MDPARLTPRVRRVDFDLFLHELMVTPKTVPGSVVEEIVDEVFLPLAAAS